MQYDTVSFERLSAWVRVTLNRPDKLNALNARMIEELTATAARVRADTAIRAVLLTAAGRGFCSGADLAGGDLLANPELTAGQNIGRRLLEAFNPMMMAWHELPVPVVVAVNGVAAGAGMSLALVGDVVLAAHSATFMQLFAPKLGLMPDLGSTYFLPRLVGTARAKGLALFGEPLAAADAERWGLIWKCVEDEALQAQAQALTQRLADGPTQAFKRIKTVFDRDPGGSLADQLGVEAVLQAELGDTTDFAEGLAAFRAKRPPRFTGL